MGIDAQITPTVHTMTASAMLLLLPACSALSLVTSSPRVQLHMKADDNTAGAASTIGTALAAKSALDGSMVADYGFDPLNFAAIDLNLGSAEEKLRPKSLVLRDYREAELRHGRLAMLAALAWPVQELFSPILSRLLREPMLLAETGGCASAKLHVTMNTHATEPAGLPTCAAVARPPSSTAVSS